MENTTNTINQNQANTDNQTAIYDLIESIQAKLNNENNNKKINENEIKDNNEILKEDVTVEQNNDNEVTENNSNTYTNNENKNIDISSIINNLNIQELINSFKGGNSQTEDTAFNFSDIDPNMLLRLQKVFSSFKKSDPKRTLIKSLKPFLRKSRQDKIGEYLMILSVVDAIGVFESKGSD